MKLSVSKIKNVAGMVMDVREEENISCLDLGNASLRLTAPLVFTGRIENTGHTLVLEGNVTSGIQMICGRCTEQVNYPVAAPFHEVYTNQPEAVNGENDEEVLLFEGDEIDITPQIAQSVLIDLPMNVLCSEECKGLCPVCGANLNLGKCQCTNESIDPRLLALKKLLNGSSTEGGVTDGSTEEKNL